MKKKISTSIVFILFLVTATFAVAGSVVVVTAVIGDQNHAPIFLSSNPSDDPRLLKSGKIQKYTISLRDDEKDTLTCTINPTYGFVSPSSMEISPSSFDSSSGTTISFIYMAPSTPPTGNLDKITVTINDGPNLVKKDLNVYVY